MFLRGTWVIQSVEHPTSAQVMISVCGSSPALGSVLTPWSLEPALLRSKDDTEDIFKDIR